MAKNVKGLVHSYNFAYTGFGQGVIRRFLKGKNCLFYIYIVYARGGQILYLVKNTLQKLPFVIRYLRYIYYMYIYINMVIEYGGREK